MHLLNLKNLTHLSLYFRYAFIVPARKNTIVFILLKNYYPVFPNGYPTLRTHRLMTMTIQTMTKSTIVGRQLNIAGILQIVVKKRQTTAVRTVVQTIVEKTAWIHLNLCLPLHYCRLCHRRLYHHRLQFHRRLLLSSFLQSQNRRYH